jgi:hypothetical protein
MSIVCSAAARPAPFRSRSRRSMSRMTAALTGLIAGCAFPRKLPGGGGGAGFKEHTSSCR